MDDEIEVGSRQTDSLLGEDRPTAKAQATRLTVSGTRVCCLYVPMLIVLTIATLTVTAGAFLLIPGSPLLEWLQMQPEASVALPVGVALIVAGSLMPPVVLVTTIWLRKPSRRRQQRDSVFADALLQEVLAPGIAYTNLVDMYSPSYAQRGSVILLAGATSPRQVNRAFAIALAQRYHTLCVDLPGHGALAGVSFSLSRAERVLHAAVEYALAAAAAAGRPTSSSSSGGGGGGGGGGPGNAASLSVASAGPSKRADGNGNNNGDDEGGGEGEGEREGSVESVGDALPPGYAPQANTARSDNTGGGTGSPLDGGNGNGNGGGGGSSSLPRPGAVVLVAYGASAHVASLYAARHPHTVAGIAVLGPVPFYTGFTRMTASVYSLPFAADLADLSVKGRIAGHRRASAEEKSRLLSLSWQYGVLPSIAREVAATPSVQALRYAPCPLLLLGPSSWLHRAAAKRISGPHTAFVLAHGLANDKLPTFNPVKVEAIAAALKKYAADCFLKAAETAAAAAAASAAAAATASAAAAAAAAAAGSAARRTSSPASGSSAYAYGARGMVSNYRGRRSSGASSGVMMVVGRGYSAGAGVTGGGGAGAAAGGGSGSGGGGGAGRRSSSGALSFSLHSGTQSFSGRPSPVSLPASFPTVFQPLPEDEDAAVAVPAPAALSISPSRSGSGNYRGGRSSTGSRVRFAADASTGSSVGTSVTE